ncbi:MAG: hypothetical protein ABEJ57_05960 [Halobacteriaceae archaeon]
MRFKPVPEPRSRSDLATIQAAVPLVPGSTEDCCARIVARTTVPSRDEARTWLTFLRALDLVDATETGYVRTDRDPHDDAVASAFRANVYGACEVCDTVDAAEGPMTAAAVADAVDIVPRWERHRSPDAERDWRTRITALLEWATVFDLLTSTASGYRPA